MESVGCGSDENNQAYFCQTFKGIYLVLEKWKVEEKKKHNTIFHILYLKRNKFIIINSPFNRASR